MEWYADATCTGNARGVCRLLFRNLVPWIIGVFIYCNMTHTGCMAADLKKFMSCNSVIYMDKLATHQAELELVIRDFDSSTTRVSCDFTIHAGVGRHVMFYITDLSLGSPNRTSRIDKSCIELSDMDGNYRSVLKGMRAIICSITEVELAPRVYATAGSALSIRFYRNRGFSMTAYVKMVFTVFRLGSCRTTERKCGNERCIAHEIVCNGHNPCGDNSDCPTGLEHLSSWAMSGIVILALLSGGIIIIMATVCLQRSGQKRNEWDDFSSTMVGTRSNNDKTVEMVDVTETAVDKQPCNNNKHGNPRVTSRDSFKSVSGTSALYSDNPHLISESIDSIDEKEKLIGNQGSSHESCSVDFVQTDSDVTVDMFQNRGKTVDKSDTITTSVSSYEIQGFSEGAIGYSGSFSIPPEMKSQFTLQPEVVHTNLTNSHSDAFSFSGNSLVLTDSDSGPEYDRSSSVDKNREKKKSKHHQQRNSSPSQNGKLPYKDTVMFNAFKPPPPPYGLVTHKHKSAFDISVNDLRTSHGE